MHKMTAIVTSAIMLAAMTVMPASAAEQVTYLRGDVNLDGVVNSKDISTLRSGLWGIRPLTGAQRMVADVNADGHVDYLDLLALTLGAANGEVSFTVDENGDPAFYLDSTDTLRVQADGWNAAVTNSANGAMTSLSRYQLTHTTADGSLMVSPWNSGLSYRSAAARTVMNANDWCASAATVYDTGKRLSTNVSAWGSINLTHDAMAEETAPFMRNTYQFFANSNRNDAIYTQTGYGVDETVYLANAEVTKREGGIEFVNYVSDDTVNSFMADDYVTIDGVTLSYSDGEFTVDGIAEDEIELLHTMTVNQYDEIAIVTNTPGNRFVYGLMYDKDSASMAALVKVRLDKNAEATVIQYSKPADMATTINFYPKDGVVDYAMEHPDEMVTLFDTQYDADHLVFQTVHFPRMTKNTLAGALNMRYQITSGITYKQTAGNASIKSSYETTASTLSFVNGSDGFSIENTENGAAVAMSFTENGDTYKLGTETFQFTSPLRYAPDAAVTYTSGNISATYTPADVLAQHVPFLY